MKLYGITINNGIESKEELKDCKEIHTYLDDNGVVVTFNNNDTEWYEYIKIIQD